MPAQAIALSGQIYPELYNTTKHIDQYTTYDFGLPFGEPQNNSATGMASLLSRFAIGVIAATAHTNPPIIVQGSQSFQGVRIQFESLASFHIILALTGGLQLLLASVVAFVAQRVSIPKEVSLSRE